MIELRCDPDLSEKPLGADRSRQLGTQHFDGNVAVVPEISRQEHFPHAAGTESTFHTIPIA